MWGLIGIARNTNGKILFWGYLGRTGRSGLRCIRVYRGGICRTVSGIIG